jgi:LemA protein
VDLLTVIALTLGLVVGFVLVVSYNRFVSQQNLIRNAWSNIDTELRRRSDLVPGLVDSVRAYASHERALFEEVTAARATAVAATGGPATKEVAERPLAVSVGRLIVVAESYPALQANAQFLELQRELVLTEDRLQAARRFYNANVRDYNERIRAFPSILIARIFGFKGAEYFDLQEDSIASTSGSSKVPLGSA